MVKYTDLFLFLFFTFALLDIPFFLKRIVTIIILLCLIAPLCGSYLYIYLKKISIKKEVAEIIKSQPDEKDVIVLTFSEEEKNTVLEWKHDREFEFRGRMYDIIDHRKEGELYIYTCYKDHKETSLNREKEKLIAKSLGQDPQQKKQDKQIKNLFSTLFCKDYFAWSSNINPPSNFEFLIFNFKFSSIIIAPLAPPPKFLS